MDIEHYNHDTKQCYEVQLDELRLGFSYRTLVAAVFNGRKLRRSNEWGPTTGRHISTLGANNFTEVSEKEMEEFVANALLQVGMANAKHILGS